MKYLIFFTGLFFFLSLASGNTPQKVFAALDCTGQSDGTTCDQWTGPNYCCAPPQCVCNTQYTVVCFAEVCGYPYASQATVYHDPSWDDCCPTLTPTPTPGDPTPTPDDGACPPPRSCWDGACKAGTALGDWGDYGCASNERCCEGYVPLPTDLEVWMRVIAYEGTSGTVKGDSGWVYTDDACDIKHLYVAPGDTLRVETMTYNRGSKDLTVRIHRHVRFNKDIKSIAFYPDPIKKRDKNCAKCRSNDWEHWLPECKKIVLNSGGTSYGNECHSPKPDMREDACRDPNPGCERWYARGAVEGIGRCCGKGHVEGCSTWGRWGGDGFDTDDIIADVWGNRMVQIKDNPAPGITEFEIEASADASQDGLSDNPDTQKVVVHLAASTITPTPTSTPIPTPTPTPLRGPVCTF